MKQRIAAAIGAVGVALALVSASPGLAQEHRRAAEGREVVMNKMYDKRKKLELNVPNLGFIMNQSYVNTMLISFGGAYYLNEQWGAGIDFAIANNSDKPERECIENFYNDPNDKIAAPCGGADNLSADAAANFGPAYVPIREIQNILTFNLIWNPVYGKQLILLSATSYFDLFVEGGISLIGSKFYPKQTTLRNGKVARGTFPDPPESNTTIGAKVEETDSYGKEGRPAPEDQNNVAVNLGVGQKFHFGKRFHVKMYIRNMTILGTESGFENLFVLFAGTGVRF